MPYISQIRLTELEGKAYQAAKAAERRIAELEAENAALRAEVDVFVPLEQHLRRNRLIVIQAMPKEKPDGSVDITGGDIEVREFPVPNGLKAYAPNLLPALAGLSLAISAALAQVEA